MHAEHVLARFAADLAPPIDRLFVAGHMAARPHAKSLRERLGIRSFGPLIDLRVLLLSLRGMTLAQAAVLQRYVDPADIARALDEEVAHDLLGRRESTYYPTARGRDVLLALTEALERGVNELWSECTVEVMALESISGTIVRQNASRLDASRYPAFTAVSQGYVAPKASPAYRLWSNLAALRYLRADAHALAWEEVALRRDSIQCLTELRHAVEGRSVVELMSALGSGREEIEAGLHPLGSRGWAVQSQERWQLTNEGREARDAIEAATNRYAAPGFLAVSSVKRNRLLRKLETLPGAPGT